MVQLPQEPAGKKYKWTIHPCPVQWHVSIKLFHVKIRRNYDYMREYTYLLPQLKLCEYPSNYPTMTAK